MFKVPEKYRLQIGSMGSDESYGNNGCFVIPHGKIMGYIYQVIASDGMSWEHVSVSLWKKKSSVHRCPTWEEMCFIKDLFWGEDDCVVQFHPPKSEYINNHSYCLHLWRSINQVQPMPDSIMVGIKS